MLDATHDPARRSWVASAERPRRLPDPEPAARRVQPGRRARPAAASPSATRSSISPRPSRAGLFAGEARRRPAAAGPTLNALMALGAGPRRALRARLLGLLADGAPERALEPLLHRAADCTMHLPAAIGDYTDFYVGIHHATNVGRLFRPDNPLLPNYKCVPIGYHGRASSIGVSRHAGAPAERPAQAAPTRPSPASARAATSTSSSSSASGSAPATRRAARSRSAEAADHIAGFCLLNDWSARDIQAWEYQPLGPFLAKNFAHHRLAVGRHPRGPGAVPHAAAGAPGRRPGAAALPARRGRPAARRPRRRARGAAADRAHARRQAARRTACRSAARATCTGRWRSWWRTTPATAATCGRATCSAPAPSRRRRARRLRQPARDHRRRPRADRTCRTARPAPSSRTATRSSSAAAADATGCAAIGFGECRGVVLPAAMLLPVAGTHAICLYTYFCSNTSS